MVPRERSTSFEIINSSGSSERRELAASSTSVLRWVSLDSSIAYNVEDEEEEEEDGDDDDDDDDVDECDVKGKWEKMCSNKERGR